MNEERIKEVECDIANLQKELEALKAEKEFKLAEAGWAFHTGDVVTVLVPVAWAKEAGLGLVLPTKELAKLHGKLHQINGRLIQARHFLCPGWEWVEGELIYHIVCDMVDSRKLSVTWSRFPPVSSVIFPDKQTAEKALEISGVRGLV